MVERLVGAAGGISREAGLSSGTVSCIPALVDGNLQLIVKLSPMPHSRLQLHQGRAHAYDLEGKLIKRNVQCEETVVAGYNASVLYNKIKD
jgi:hypothetical protein